MENSPKKSAFIAPAQFDSLRDQTLRQIEKDFALQGIEIEIHGGSLPFGELVGRLAKNLDDLGVTSSPKLQPLLYQLDISEQFVREEIFAAAEKSHTSLLADAIIKRCFAKVLFRKKYS